MNGEPFAHLLAQATRHLASSRPAEAEALLRPLAADSGRASFLLGAALHQQGRPAEALEAFAAALGLSPLDVDAEQARAVVLLELGRAAEASALLSRRIEAAWHPDLAASLATLLEDLGEDPRAEALYRRVLGGDPLHPVATQNLSALLLRRGRPAEALAILKHAGLHGPRADLAYNRAEALLALARDGEALEAADEAIRLDPGHVFAHIDRGIALAALGRIAEAEAAFGRARALDPARVAAYRNPLRTGRLAGDPDFDARAIHLYREFQRLKACDWRGYRSLVESFRSYALAARDGPVPLGERWLAFSGLLLPIGDDARLCLAEAIAGRVRGNAAALAPRAAPAPRDRDGRLRIGWLSPNFRVHANSLVNREVLAAFDRSRFEVIGFSICPDDGSAARQTLVESLDALHQVDHLDDQALARLIRAEDIHLLVDVGGQTQGSRAEVLAMKPAPLVVGLVGFPGTMGAGLCDYLVVDRTIVPPESESHYSEALARLPGCYFPYPRTPPRSTRVCGRAEAGLPERGTVYCAFHQVLKLEPEGFALWMRVLLRVPDSVLWLLDHGPQARENLRQSAAGLEVDPARLVFAPRLPVAEHLTRQALADVYLDTLGYSAHTTAWDALQAGVPVLTRTGRDWVSRVASSILKSCGLADLIARDAAELEDLAVRLGGDASGLAALRERVREGFARSPATDARAYTRDLGRAFEAMWARHRAGLAPRTFDLPPET